MFDIKRFTLKNGLRLIVQSDFSSPVIALNLLYNAGSKHEDPSTTGLAHLFEHMMFSGTQTIPDFDKQLTKASGESNAFTNTDITNYYITIPVENIETALWLEADRMQNLDISEKKLAIQKNVVTEEFRQRYLNQPYGDIFLLLRPLVYKSHPYMWPTIGREIAHIEKITVDQANRFHKEYYAPDNTIMVIVGSIKPEKAYNLVSKWFDAIPPGNRPIKTIPVEPEQTESRYLEVERDVPADVICKAWVIPGRNETEYYHFDMITDILAGGESGRLYKRLVRDKRVFSDVNAYITGEIEKGTMVVAGSVAEGVNSKEAAKILDEEIAKLSKRKISDYEYQKVINRYTTSFHMSVNDITSRASSLALYELLGDAEMINKETVNYCKTTPQDIINSTQKRLSPQRMSTLMYNKGRK